MKRRVERGLGLTSALTLPPANACWVLLGEIDMLGMKEEPPSALPGSDAVQKGHLRRGYHSPDKTYSICR